MNLCFLESVGFNKETDVHFSPIKGYYNTEIICTKNVHISNYEYLTKFLACFSPPREANDRRSKFYNSLYSPGISEQKETNLKVLPSILKEL